MKNHIFLILAGINILNATETNNSKNNKQMPLDLPLSSNVIPDADATEYSKFIPSNMGANSSNAATNLNNQTHNQQ
ncbi:MAG: hypothetical protein P4L22_04355 [Candidatus Babeliales bacterium]|nr:hypothetical protein [Candidatus Babeliales bacterium]